MKMGYGLGAAGAALLLLSSLAPGQSTADSAQAVTAPPRDWSFYASGFAYFVPEDRDYLAPICTADRDRLHLEARYNYEDLETAALFLGWNFSAGDKLSLHATPMIGGVFGNTAGIAPGFKITLGYQRVEFYSESEYLFDAHDSSESFYYNWSELSYALLDWSHAGLVIQRTKVYQTELDVQRGLLAGFSHGEVDCTAYVFNLGWTSPTVVLALGYGF